MKKFIESATILCLLLWAAPAAAQIPNGQGTLDRVAREQPAAWACAHTGRGCSWDWIRIAACELHKENPRFGLNGKRGNPNDLSMDVIAWKGEGVQPDAVNGGRMQLFDVIGGAGGPDPRVVWNLIDDGTAGAWVDPGSNCGGAPGGGGGGGGTEPQPQPKPTDLTPLLQKLDQVVVELRNVNGQLYNITTQQAYANERLAGIEQATKDTAAVASNLVADGSWLAQTLEALRAVPQALNRGVKVRF